MAKPKRTKTKAQLRRRRQSITRLVFIVGALGLALALGWQIQANQHQTARASEVSAEQTRRLGLLHQVELLTISTNALQGQINPNTMTTLKAQLSQIRLTIFNSHYDVAEIMLADFVVAQAKAKHAGVPAPPTPAAVITPEQSTALAPGQIPILIYHKPPADFETQLQVLQAKGYTTVRMSQVAAHLHGAGGSWPAKPVAITFDDGFSQQMSAFALLQKYHMVATFYLIVGHPTLGFCLGLNQDKTAPCADSYLTWDQAKTLAGSGIIEIGDHTMDHLALAQQTEAVQRDQILSAKSELESRLGLTITTFAYPYGSYNGTTINIVASNGFTNAVTTNPGINQSLGGIYTLNRVRNTYSLP